MNGAMGRAHATKHFHCSECYTNEQPNHDGGSVDALIDGVVDKMPALSPRYDLIPADALREVALVFAYGAAKYGDRNWEGDAPLSPHRVICTATHALNHAKGKEVDESGLSSLGHAAASALMATALHLRKTSPVSGNPVVPCFVSMEDVVKQRDSLLETIADRAVLIDKLEEKRKKNALLIDSLSSQLIRAYDDLAVANESFDMAHVANMDLHNENEKLSKRNEELHALNIEAAKAIESLQSNFAASQRNYSELAGVVNEVRDVVMR